MTPLRMADIPKFTRSASYMVNIHWSYLERAIKGFKESDNFDMDPDFQREHVWDDEKRSKYIEFILQGGSSGMDILTNCPHYGSGHGDPEVRHMILVDGKQRLESVRMFMRDELLVFGGHRKSDYTDHSQHIDLSFRFNWHVNDLPTREQILSWYLDVNNGGIVHTQEELSRVRTLLDNERSRKSSRKPDIEISR